MKLGPQLQPVHHKLSDIFTQADKRKEEREKAEQQQGKTKQSKLRKPKA